jgi:hypothetical protein
MPVLTALVMAYALTAFVRVMACTREMLVTFQYAPATVVDQVMAPATERNINVIVKGIIEVP